MSTRETVMSDGQWLLYGGRFLANVPTTVTFTPSADDFDPLDFAVTLKIDIIDGRLGCVSLTTDRLPDSPPISGESLRRVPVAEYVALAAKQGAGILLERIPQPNGTCELVEFSPPPLDFADDGMTDEALEQMARLYAWAQATGRKATGILLGAYGMPRPTATRWIQIARRRGILRDDHEFEASQ